MERFRFIIFKIKHNEKQILLNISLIYLLSLSISFIDFQKQKSSFQNETSLAMCDKTDGKFFSILFLFFTITPLILILILNAFVYKKLSKISNKFNIKTKTEKKHLKEARNFLKTHAQSLTVLVSTQLPFFMLTAVQIFIYLEMNDALAFFYNLTFIFSCMYACLILVPYTHLIPKKSCTRVYNLR